MASEVFPSNGSLCVHHGVGQNMSPEWPQEAFPSSGSLCVGHDVAGSVLMVLGRHLGCIEQQEGLYTKGAPAVSWCTMGYSVRALDFKAAHL